MSYSPCFFLVSLSANIYFFFSCVFSGNGVAKLRNYLNAEKAAIEGSPVLGEQPYYVDDDDTQDMEEYGEIALDEVD